MHNPKPPTILNEPRPVVPDPIPRPETREVPADGPTTIDHRALLVKYMRHVVQEEGWDFLLSINAGQSSDVKFAESEVVELQRISREANPEGGYPFWHA